MAITSIKKRSINNEVFEQMKEQIISGEWERGCKIPGELLLVKEFEVSRPTIRDALHKLIGMGLLTAKRGEGTFVTEAIPEDYFKSLLPILMIEKNNFMDVLEFRSVVEVKSAGFAALRADSDDIKRLEKIIENMEIKYGDIRRFAMEDLNFHMAVAVASKNSVIIRVNNIIHDLLTAAMEKIVDTTGFERGIKYHKKILEAIKNNDRKSAENLMKEHIDITIESMSETLERK